MITDQPTASTTSARELKRGFPRRALFIVPADYDALKRKGLDDEMLRRDEEEFLERVVTVHPLASKTRVLKLPGNNTLYEVGMDFIPGFASSRLVRAMFAPLHFLRVLLRIIALIRREQIGFVRANDPYWMGLLGWGATRVTGVPLCISIHSDYDKRHELAGGGETYTLFGWRWPAEKVCRLVLSSARLVLPIRESLGAWAVSHGAPPKRVRIIPHGIDMSAFQQPCRTDIRGRFGLPDHVPLLSFAGRLSRENYVGDLLTIAEGLLRRGWDFRMLIAGSGEEEPALRSRLAVMPELASKVILTGSLPRETILDMRRASYVSLCLMGGFSLIEACAAGRPVVAYDVEWHYELVHDGETGRLLPEHDVAGVMEAVSTLLANPALAEEMGLNARRLAMERHDSAQVCKAKQQCYQELLDGNP